MKWLYTALGALIVVAALAWALWPRPFKVEATTIGRHKITLTVEDEGKSRVRDVFVVSAPISGELSRIDLHAGDTVVAHSTVLASIKPVSPSLLDKRARLVAEASIDAAKAAVDLASAQLRQATAQAYFMKAEQHRAEILSHQGTISQTVYDKAVLDASVAAADEDRAKANLAVQQRQYESARAVIFPVSTGSNQGPCCVDVFAPTSGQVLRIVTESEQVVQMGTPLVEVGDTNDIEVAVDLLSRDAVRVVPGNKAVIDGWGGPALSAKVVRVDPVAVTKVSALGIEEQRVSTVLKLDGANQPGQRLGHGFRVVAHIVVWEEDNILSIPVSALFRVGTDWATYIIKDNVARLKKLTLGEKNDELAAVTSGLAEGDTVILHPSDLLVEGAKVEILPAP